MFCQVYLKGPGTVEIQGLPVPQVVLVAIANPQNVTIAGAGSSEVDRQSVDVGTKHMVVEPEHTGVLRLTLAVAWRGLEDPAHQHGPVLKLLRSGGLDVDVVPVDGAKGVVLHGARVEGRCGALDLAPVKHVRSTPLLSPAAQALFEITLQLWGWTETRSEQEDQETGTDHEARTTQHRQNVGKPLP